MQSKISKYSLFLHTLIVVLIGAVIWQAVSAHGERARERQKLEKYGPVVQKISDTFGIGIEVRNFEDVITVFEVISTQGG